VIAWMEEPTCATYLRQEQTIVSSELAPI